MNLRRACVTFLIAFALLITRFAAAAEPARVEVMLQEGGEGIEIFQRIAAEYEKLRPGVRVEITADPRMSDKLRVRILEKNFPELTNADFGAWPLIRHGDVLALDEFLDRPSFDDPSITWRQSFLAGTLERFNHNGHTYGVPLSYYVQGIWYNKKMFREHGWREPATWDELLDLCAKIKASGIAPMAFQGRYVYYAQAIVDAANFQLVGREAYWKQKQLEPGTFDNPQMVQALAYVQQLGTKYFMPGAMGMDHTSSQLQFFLGNAAMIPCGSWLKSEMAGKIPPGFELGTFNYPAVPGGKGDPSAVQAFGGFYTIFAGSKHPREAADFLRFLTSRKTASMFCRERDMPVATRGVNENRLSSDLTDLAAMIKKSSTSYGEARGEGFPLMQQEWDDVNLALLTGKTTPAAAAADLESRAARVRQLTLDPDSAPVRHVAKPLVLLTLLLVVAVWSSVTSLRQMRRLASSRRARTTVVTRLLAWRHVMIFVAPSLLLFVIFVLVPALKSFTWSTQQWDGLTDARWAGLRHFRHLLFESDAFWIALRNNLYIMLVIPAFVVPLSLFLAAAISRGVRGAKIFRATFLIPSAMGGVAATLLWLHLYDPQAGVINAALGAIGFKSFQGFAWLSQDHLYTAIVPMSVWAGFGFNVVLLLAAMEAIPGELYEAAQIDGATTVQQFRSITLPLIWEVLSIATVFLIIGGMKAFESIWLLTNQAPSTDVHVIGTRMIQAMFGELNMGQATAIAVLMFAMVFAASAVALKLMRRETIEM